MMKDQDGPANQDGPTDQDISRPKRKITLTFTGIQLYEEIVTKFLDRQNKLRS